MPPISTRMKLDASTAAVGCLVLASGLVFPAEQESGGGFGSVPVKVATNGRTGFTQLSPVDTGIFFTNQLTVERYLTNQIYLNGSGVAAGDVDGDGRCDLFFCHLGGPSALYRNLGNWKFEDVTEKAGVACAGLDATGAAFVDIDGDGDLDLIVNSVGGGTHVFLNDGKGHFREMTAGGVLNPGKGGMSLALGDIDGDGYLDLYIANYRADTIRDHPQTRLHGDRINGKLVVQSVNGRPVTQPDLVGRFTLTESGKIIENGEADLLLRNEGGTNFVLIPFTGGAFLDEEGRPLKE